MGPCRDVDTRAERVNGSGYRVGGRGCRCAAGAQGEEEVSQAQAAQQEGQVVAPPSAAAAAPATSSSPGRMSRGDSHCICCASPLGSLCSSWKKDCWEPQAGAARLLELFAFPCGIRDCREGKRQRYEEGEEAGEASEGEYAAERTRKHRSSKRLVAARSGVPKSVTYASRMLSSAELVQVVQTS